MRTALRAIPPRGRVRSGLVAAAVLITAMVVAATAAAAAGSGPVGRDDAAAQARRELSRGIYHADDRSLLQRVWDRVVHWLDRAVSEVSGRAPGGAVGLLVVVAAVAALVWFAVWRAGPLRRSRRRGEVPAALDTTLNAAQHRRLAEQFAASGRYAEAVRERMRAVVRELETRGVLEPRPGRTADEVAAEAGAEMPAVGPALRTAAAVFGEVWYGGRPATAAADRALRDVDELVRRSPLAVSR